MRVFKEIYDGSDLRDWAINEGWCLEYTINRLDETDNWDLAFSFIEELELSEVQLNDFLRFDIDDILDEYEEEDEEDEEEDEEDEEEDEEEKTERLFFNVLLDEEEND